MVFTLAVYVPWFIWLIVLLPIVIPTVWGLYRAARNRDLVWFLGILGGWCLGLGWLDGLPAGTDIDGWEST